MLHIEIVVSQIEVPTPPPNDVRNVEPSRKLKIVLPTLVCHNVHHIRHSHRRPLGYDDLIFGGDSPAHDNDFPAADFPPRPQPSTSPSPSPDRSRKRSRSPRKPLLHPSSSDLPPSATEDELGLSSLGAKRLAQRSRSRSRGRSRSPSPTSGDEPEAVRGAPVGDAAMDEDTLPAAGAGDAMEVRSVVTKRDICNPEPRPQAHGRGRRG